MTARGGCPWASKVPAMPTALREYMQKLQADLRSSTYASESLREPPEKAPWCVAATRVALRDILIQRVSHAGSRRGALRAHLVRGEEEGEGGTRALRAKPAAPQCFSSIPFRSIPSRSQARRIHYLSAKAASILGTSTSMHPTGRRRLRSALLPPAPRRQRSPTGVGVFIPPRARSSFPTTPPGSFRARDAHGVACSAPDISASGCVLATFCATGWDAGGCLEQTRPHAHGGGR